MNYTTSHFIIDKLENESCGRFVDSRKKDRITFSDNSWIINMLNSHDMYNDSIRYGYLKVFDILYSYLHDNMDDELVQCDNFLKNMHSTCDRHDGLLYVYMFLMHHVIELHLKYFYEKLFNQKKNGHKCNSLWCDLRYMLLSYGYDVSYFNAFFEDKEKCCSDGFSGRYYRTKNGEQYLMHSLFIDIGSIYSTVHKFIKEVTTILRHCLSRYDS